YNIRHVSVAGSLESTGVTTTCTPTSPLLAPAMNAEPATTPGTSNTVSWTNGGSNDPTLECNVQISTTDLSVDPLAFDDESGWGGCSSSTTTYNYTFTGLTVGTTYYYHVQTRTGANEKSPFSEPVSSQQTASSGGGGGGGGGLTSVCGNGILEAGEQCDDGNKTNGDGCNSSCKTESGFVNVQFKIKAVPEFRVPNQSNDNLSLNAQFLVYKPSISNLDVVQVHLDDEGNTVYDAQIVPGTYDFGLNGEAHNTKIIRNINITDSTNIVTLDFTLADTFKLTAGDNVDDNYINGLDMSKLIYEYRKDDISAISDLNKDGYVNGIDASIIITNYRKEGETF
ncbi:DUF4215 domain-containing protein, partial [bacterium]|nr:DUF4215 domain-containing protein [bacterium]